ncbi:hypothetical protein E2L06_13665 [Haloterrigena sp. H1]|uniref:DUF5787 family protein n=1 Tax=Haloterrigena sp. H1 TaxID=2552943 RepID=UPI00110D318C|nr:DUF5787 family protein [Haloterrigena sp. H1]TMT87573.1 hypothetical protein E2L06_13665 [Haloterrigena sp. H1]
MSEFAFELELCTHLESRQEGIVARQLGAGVAAPGGRILDIVCVEPGPAFDERVAITSESIPDAAVASAVGTGRARYWKDAFDCHPDRARRAVDRALESGFFERDHTASAAASREYVRQTARYPDWYDRLVGIENKPDLGRPGDLESQLRTDVSLAVADEIVLATESYVTRAHLHRIPDDVGVWRVHRDDASRGLEIEVIREPASLPVDEPGIEPLAFEPGRTEIEVVSPESKARARRRLAERAYGKGWRTYEFPACKACQPVDADGATLPYCAWADRAVDATTECGPSCPGYEQTVAPAVDLEAERDRQTAWEADPDGTRRRQAGLDQFG